MLFTDILDKYSIPYVVAGQHHHATSNNVQLDCPWCDDGSNSWHLGYHTKWGTVNCWRCGKCNLVKVLQEITKEPFPVAVKLANSLDRTSHYEFDGKPRGKLVIPKGVGALQLAHRNYLRSRNLDPDELSRVWGVQGIGLSVSLPWRIWIPIHFQRKVVSWTTRSIDPDAKVRYVTAKPEEEAISSKSLLIGSELAEHSIIVVEGPIDAFRIGPGAVATTGINVSKAQILKLSKYPRRTVAFDNEPMAQARASELCYALQSFPGVTRRIEIDAKDPGIASDKEIELIRKNFLE